MPVRAFDSNHKSQTLTFDFVVFASLCQLTQRFPCSFHLAFLLPKAPKTTLCVHHLILIFPLTLPHSCESACQKRLQHTTILLSFPCLALPRTTICCFLGISLSCFFGGARHHPLHFKRATFLREFLKIPKCGIWADTRVLSLLHIFFKGLYFAHISANLRVL